jgi:penicillin amidase
VIKSILRFTLLLIILIAGFAGLAIYWTFYKPLPDYEASLNIESLQQSTSIFWDDFGIPHIFASSELDAYTTLGYVHAQDRLWQMTLSQLFVQGRFAEFIGEDVIEFDKYSRTIGFWRVAAEIESSMDSKELQILQAYSNGVNSFISQNQNRLPIEFSLIGMKPITWTPRHSIALSRALGWELNVSWWSKIMLGYLENHLPPDALADLFPEWGPNAPRTINAAYSNAFSASALPFLKTDINLRSLMGQKGSHIGSNAWVVDGSRSETGYPLLAGDPHLGLDMPGKWYEVHMSVNGKNVSGATVAGAPIIILGQNDHHAWSFTSVMGDDTDFFIEKINPQDRSQYLSDIRDSIQIFSPFNITRELIKTKEGEEILFEIRKTQNGPIINDIYQNKALLDDQLISMNWSGYHKSNEIKALINMAWSEDFQTFQNALNDIGVPALNIMYADISGNIAMFTVGNFPVRMNAPLLFKNGSDIQQRWTQFIPRNQLPKIINPISGYIANANNPVVDENYPYYITSFWEPDSRIRRIDEVIQSKRLHSKQSFKDLQIDNFSHQAKDITELIIPILNASSDTLIQKALPYLQNWDYRYTKNATAASVYETFFLKFVENTFKPYLGDAVFQNFIQLENFPIRVTTRMLKNGSVWLQSADTTHQYRDSLIVTSMKESVLDLYQRFGPEPSEWRWENLHKLTLSPPLFSEAVDDENASSSLKLIVKIVLSRGPYAVEGHSMTVNNAQYDWNKPFDQVLGASIRRIVDLSDLSQSESVLPTGQSGNPLSRHFGDQSDLWLTGKYRIFEHNTRIPEQVRYRTMSLNP